MLQAEEVPPIVRQALEAQVQRGSRAAAPILDQLREDSGAVALAVAMMLDLAGLSLRRQVRTPRPRFFELPAILARLVSEGSIATGAIEVMTDMLTYAAAVAGGIRPALQPLLDRYFRVHVLDAAWLTLNTALRATADVTFTPEAALLRCILDDYWAEFDR